MILDDNGMVIGFDELEEHFGDPDRYQILVEWYDANDEWHWRGYHTLKNAQVFARTVPNANIIDNY